MAIARRIAIATPGAGPTPHPDQPPLDVRIEHVSAVRPKHLSTLPLPTLGGLVRYSMGEAITAVDRSFDLVFTVGDAGCPDALSRRLAYHRRTGIPAVGLFVSDRYVALPETLSVGPDSLATTFDALVHNLLAPFLIGIVCVDWHDVLTVVETGLPLAIAFAAGDDAGVLGRTLAGRLPGRLAVAHAALYAPIDTLRLRDIRAFASCARAAAADGAPYVYSAAGRTLHETRFCASLLGALA